MHRLPYVHVALQDAVDQSQRPGTHVLEQRRDPTRPRLSARLRADGRGGRRSGQSANRPRAERRGLRHSVGVQLRREPDDRPRPEVLLEHTRFYRHFGLKVRGHGEDNELPDHLCCQLEAMAWLGELEARTRREARPTEGFERAQADFLDKLLIPFLDQFVPTLELELSRRGGDSLFAAPGGARSPGSRNRCTPSSGSAATTRSPWDGWASSVHWYGIDWRRHGGGIVDPITKRYAQSRANTPLFGLWASAPGDVWGGWGRGPRVPFRRYRVARDRLPDRHPPARRSCAGPTALSWSPARREPFWNSATANGRRCRRKRRAT